MFIATIRKSNGQIYKIYYLVEAYRDKNEANQNINIFACAKAPP